MRRVVAAHEPGSGPRRFHIRDRTAGIVLLACAAIIGVLTAVGVVLVSLESEQGMPGGETAVTNEPAGTPADQAAVADLRAGALVGETAFVPPYPSAPSPNGAVHDVLLTAAPTATSIVADTSTDVWSFNGSVPGPELRVRLGDTLRVTVQNRLPAPTSVHWHGIRVPNDMDGVPGINQDPIAPGDSFVYEFTPPDAGSFWYHSHNRGNEQVERGLYGALVVEDADPPPYSQDVVWVLDDWLLGPDGQLDPDFDSSDDIQHNGRWGDIIGVNGADDLSMTVAPGQRIRLRLINASNARIYRLDFDRLAAIAVAIDGLYVNSPFDANNVELSPGGRVDIDLAIPVDATGTYVVSDSFTSSDGVPLASIAVAGSPVSPPGFDIPSGEVPDWSIAAGSSPTATFVLSITGEEAGPAAGLAGEPQGDFRWAINGRSWPEPTSYIASVGIAEKIRFVNDSGSFHPMHLHGQFFQIIARDGVAVREGYFRDTVLLSPDETVDIVVVPLDKGVWALHCHTQTHAEYGMLMLYEVR